MEIEARFEYQPREVSARFVWRRRFWALLVFAFGLLSLITSAGPGPSARGLLALDGIVFCWFALRVLRTVQTRGAAVMRQTAGIRRLKISEDGLSSTTDLGSRTVSWTAVRRVRRSSGWWSFYGPDRPFTFPQRVLTAEQTEQMEALLKSRGLMFATPPVSKAPAP